ncbi:MAG: RNA 3'-terminal phosphate cyclase [Candidatus Micrarchaeota archaeon]|nr:RNA 3'-terminal phosphate cyclase [Candidatus Micrarchaeota archaeon]
MGIITIDGSHGSGGGQVLRTALSLSAIINQPFTITDIRSKRPKPGLQAQHLTCVKSLQQICNAEVKGAELGSTTVEFTPRKINCSKYSFDIGTAGSITLLAQCILPVLLFADGESEVNFVGGTHVPFSPVVDYFSQVFLPTIKKMGINAEFEMQRCGWFPVGGGKATLIVKPCKELKPLNLTARETAPNVTVSALYSQLPEAVGQRLADSTKKFFGKEVCCAEMKVEKKDASCPGCAVFLKADYGNCVAGFSALGKKGKPAEDVGKEAAKRFLEFQNTAACVDEHLADQILLYATLAKGKSEFTTEKISEHFETNAYTIGKFLEKKIKVEKSKVVVC